MNPQISIIVPVYNVEKYLSQCLDSIINQTIKDIEIICVYDESNDNSLNILRQYLEKDSRIKIIHNSGKTLGSARNIGVQHASTEYICFVDSDDWIETNTCELVLKKMTDDIDFVYYGANLVLEGDIPKNQIDSIIYYYQNKFEGKVELDTNIIKNTVINAWNKIYRRSILTKYNILFPDGQFEDGPFFYKHMSVCKKAYYINEYLYNYRQHKDSAMYKIYAKNIPLVYQRMLHFNDIYQFMESTNILEKNLPLFIYAFKDFFKWDYSFCPDNQKTELLEKTTEILTPMDLEKYYINEELIKKILTKDYNDIDKFLE